MVCTFTFVVWLFTWAQDFLTTFGISSGTPQRCLQAHVVMISFIIQHFCPPWMWGHTLSLGMVNPVSQLVGGLTVSSCIRSWCPTNFTFYIAPQFICLSHFYHLSDPRSHHCPVSPITSAVPGFILGASQAIPQRLPKAIFAKYKSNHAKFPLQSFQWLPQCP